jgi:predicted SnoaL-like aldol condensation-catalyzing enzyme
MMADTREVIQRVFDDIINKRDIDAADELLSEEFVDHGPMGDLHGRDAVKGLFRQWLSAVPDAHCTVYNVIVEGDLAGWLVRTTGTHTGDGLGFPATGKPFETVAVNMGRFQDGVAVEHWSEQGLFPMLVQIGMMPLPGQ